MTRRHFSILLIILSLILAALTVWLLLQLQWAGRLRDNLEESINVQATEAWSIAQMSTIEIATFEWEWTLIWETKESWENIANTAATESARLQATETADTGTATAARGTLEASITTAMVQAQERISTAEARRATFQAQGVTAQFVAQSNQATSQAVQTQSIIDRATIQADAGYQIATANAAQLFAENQAYLSAIESANSLATADAAQWQAYNSGLEAQAARAELNQYQTEVANIFTATASVPTAAPTIGRIVTARQLGPGGCALEPVSSFMGTEDRIYVVAENTSLPAGTTFFARWYLNGAPYQDSTLGVADRDYTNVCVSFSIAASETDTFTPGNYRVEFYANNVTYGSTTFTVTGGE